jgi:prepilin-type processing-associated H-X9-DG protein
MTKPPMPSSPFLANRESAFHRLDLLAVLGVLALLVLAVLPVLSNTTARGERIACMNNLRLITRGFYQWSIEHSDLMPWWVPSSEGGARGHSLKDNLWFHYSIVSNQLESPKLLADPGDQKANLQVARSWDNNPAGGFANGAYRDNAVSYFLGMHAMALYPRSVLTGDRNISVSDRALFCPSLIPCWNMTPQTATWTSAVHGELGNLAFMDGSVEQADIPSLKRTIQWSPSDAVTPWNTHFVFPP